MMGRILVAVLGLVLTLSLCSAQDPKKNGEQAIKALDRELETALSKGDSVTLDRILSEDYIEINPQGDVRKKADLMTVARAMSAGSRGVSIGPDTSVDELTVRLHGDSALVVGRTTIRYQFMEYQTTGPQKQTQNPVTIDQQRFIRTYVKTSGRWQLVAWQTTAVAKR
jgi:hypothetical protein